MSQHLALPVVIFLTCALLTMTSIGSVAPTDKCWPSNNDAEARCYHRSHFGSRYTLGCCACAGLLAQGSILADCTFGRKQEVDRTAENNIAIFVEVFCFEGLTANPPSSIMDFGGFYSIIILMLRHGIPRPACREFPGKFEWTMLVGRLGVYGSACEIAPGVWEDLTN